MRRKPDISTASPIGTVIFSLLGTTILGACIQGAEFEDLKNTSVASNDVHLSPTYRRIRYSISKGTVVEEKVQPSVDISVISDSTLLPPEINNVTGGLGISSSKTENNTRVFLVRDHTLAPEVSLHSPIKPLVISPNLPKEEDIKNDTVTSSPYLREEIQEEIVWSSSTPYPILSTSSGSITNILHQSIVTSNDDSTESNRDTDDVLGTETPIVANTDRISLVALSEVKYSEREPNDLDAQATAPHSSFKSGGESNIKQSQLIGEKESQTVAILENEDEILANATEVHVEKVELYGVPKEAREIIALNSQLLGYDTGKYQDSTDLHSPKHSSTALGDDEHSTIKDTAESSSAPPVETTTRKRTSRRRRRRRKGQTSDSSRKEALQINESSEGGESIRMQTLQNRSIAETIEHENTTNQPLYKTRNRYGMRRVKYTGRSTTGDYKRRETLATSESAHVEPNADVEKTNGRARSQVYRMRRPRYRVKVRRPNNHTLSDDETFSLGNIQLSEINNATESRQNNVFQETTESLPSQQETGHFPVTTLRTHIIHAINELQQINTLIASRKDDISNNIKNDALPQPVILQSRPLIQNSLRANASLYEGPFLRNPKMSEQEISKLLHALSNRPHVKTPLNPEFQTLKDFFQQHHRETTPNLQVFNNFTQKYEKDFSSAASTIQNNVTSGISRGNRHPKQRVKNDTQNGIISSVYLLDGIPVRALIEKDLVTSEQQRSHPRMPSNAVSNICQNGTIPEIIECIRNIDQRRSPGRKASYSGARNSAERDFSTSVQVNDLKLHRSSRNSTAPDILALVDRQNEGSLRNNRNSLSEQSYSTLIEQGIQLNSTQQYLSPSNRNPKTVSSNPKWNLANVHSGTGGKPTANTMTNNKGNNKLPSLSGALRAGGRMLLSQLQKLKNAILQIPGHFGRLSAELGKQKQAQQSKPPSFPTSLFSPRSSSSSFFNWR